MKKYALLFILLAALTACWDDDHDGWGSRHYTAAVTVSMDCHHAPFRIYIDGRDSEDRAGEIGEPGGTVLLILERGWHSIYIKDEMGDWIYEDDFYLDEDRDIFVHC